MKTDLLAGAGLDRGAVGLVSLQNSSFFGAQFIVFSAQFLVLNTQFIIFSHELAPRERRPDREAELRVERAVPAK